MNKTIGVIAVIGVLLGGFALWNMPTGVATSPSGDNLGAAGGLTAENYWPYVMYNGGYYSLKDIITNGGIMAVGTSTPTSNGDLVVDNSTGTSTITVSSGLAGRGGCIEMELVGGGVGHIIATSTAQFSNYAIFLPGGCI